MAIYTGMSSDPTLNGYLSLIRTAEYGSDARSAMANAVQRCYQLAVEAHGGNANGISQDTISAKNNRIMHAYYGDTVRDAFADGIRSCYIARGISFTVNAGYIRNELINAQLGEELKNAIMKSIVQCCHDVWG